MRRDRQDDRHEATTKAAGSVWLVPARPTIAMEINLDGQPLESETTFTWAGAHVLTIHTAVPRQDLAFEVHSTFVGHPEVATYGVHLVLGPVGEAPSVEDSRHHSGELAPMVAPRACVFDHSQRIIELLRRHGHEVRIDPPGDAAFDELERGVTGRS